MDEMSEDGLSGGEIAAAVIGSIVGFVLLFIALLFLLRIWMRGPTKGTDNKKKLDGKVVAITGKKSFNGPRLRGSGSL